MKLIFTKSNMPLSIAIRWCLNEPVSHMAIVFDDKIVFHSNLLGTHVNWFESFKKHQTIVYSQFYQMGMAQEENIYLSCVSVDSKWYDYLAFFKLCYYGLRKKLFGKPLPIIKDQWPNAFLCTELIKVLPEKLLKPELKEKLAANEILTPYQLYKNL